MRMDEENRIELVILKILFFDISQIKAGYKIKSKDEKKKIVVKFYTN